MPPSKKPITQRIYQISILILLGVLMTSCSESKVSQCSKLINIANRAVSGVKAVSEDPKPNSIDSINKIADVANSAKAEMEDLQLTDDQLKGYRERFVTMYTDTNQAARDLVAAAEAKDAQAAQAAYDALETATAPEQSLVTDVNTYCEAQPSPTGAASPSASPEAPDAQTTP